MTEAPLLLYDGRCGFCGRWSRRLAAWDRAGRIRQQPYQARARLPGVPAIEDAALDRALHVVLPDGRIFTGARGVIALLPWLPGGRPLGWLARLPGVGWAADWVYEVVARRRHRGQAGDDACATR
jgi:predicted DCC family thiol-disulfide oxidoreductase YuxK